MVGGRVTTNFGGVDVVPLLGAIAGCQFLFHIFLLYSGPPISPRHVRKQQWILSWTSWRRYTVLYIDNTKIGFGYLGSMLGLFCLNEFIYVPFWFWVSEARPTSSSPFIAPVTSSYVHRVRFLVGAKMLGTCLEQSLNFVCLIQIMLGMSSGLFWLLQAPVS